MSAVGRTKRFLTELGVQFVADIAWGYILYQIKDCTAEDVYQAIVEDIDLWKITPEKEKSYVQNTFVKRFKPQINKYADRITPELIFRGLQKDRPDMAGVIINFQDGKGFEWLERQTVNIINIVKNM